MATWTEVLDSELEQTLDAQWWAEYFDAHPDVLHRLLGDLYQITSDAKDRPPTLDDLWDLVAPRFTMEPFGDAVRGLLNGRSIRSVAAQVGLDHAQLVRYLKGTASVVRIHDPVGSMRRIELIARALKVHPAYFVEWRRLWILSLIDGALAEKPNLSIGIYQRYAKHDTSARRA